LLASLLVAVAVAVVGLGAGVTASTGATAAPAGPALVEDVAESTLASSTRRRGGRRTVARDVRCSPARLTVGQVQPVETRLARWLRLAPPSLRGPPVLLI
jgi:hypothetical protein